MRRRVGDVRLPELHVRPDGVSPDGPDVRWGCSLEEAGEAVQGVAENRAALANHGPLGEVVAAVNRKLQGWNRYFSVGTLEPAYRTVDRYTEALFRQFLVRRHKVPGRGTRPFREPIPSRGAWPPTVGGSPAGGAPACLDVRPVREPDAGKPHVWFDERVRETGSWTGC